MTFINTVRALYRREEGESGARGEKEDAQAVGTHKGAGRTDATSSPGQTVDDDASFDKQRRRSCARLLRRIYEEYPLVCPCGGELKIISVLTEPVVVVQGGSR